jgi:hypothetical protein
MLAAPSSPHFEAEGRRDSPHAAQVFKVTAYYSPTRNVAKARALQSIPAERYDGDIAALLEDETFYDAVRKELVQAGILNSTVAVSVRLGKNGRAHSVVLSRVKFIE